MAKTLCFFACYTLRSPCIFGSFFFAFGFFDVSMTLALRATMARSASSSEGCDNAQCKYCHCDIEGPAPAAAASTPGLASAPQKPGTPVYLGLTAIYCTCCFSLHLHSYCLLVQCCIRFGCSIADACRCSHALSPHVVLQVSQSSPSAASAASGFVHWAPTVAISATVIATTATAAHTATKGSACESDVSLYLVCEYECVWVNTG